MMKASDVQCDVQCEIQCELCEVRCQRVRSQCVKSFIMGISMITVLQCYKD